MLRSHTCNEARAADEGQEMVLVGWVDSLRDHGGVRFLDLRDRYGRTQVTLHPDRLGERFALDQLRCEQVVQVRGVVRLRPEGMQNPRLDTGKVELEAVEVEVLGDCPPLPFDLSETAGEVGEELRFRYRYLDMRRDSVKDRFIFRSNLLHSMRDFLHREGFVELETPVLTKSTPEGARDFLVPSRISPGTFYALPQSPQIFKQIFMVAGFDRYMQVVRCFRDESLRADRQPEFTQLDLELACVHEEDVIDVVERLVKSLVKELMGVEITEAFPRLGYREALDRFGTDRPDQRYDLELVDITDLAAEMGFRVFQSACEAGGRVRGLCLRGGARMSRKEITELEAGLKDQGAKGLAWVKRTAEGATGPLGRFLGGEGGARLFERMGAAPADLLLFVADDKPAIVDASLAQLRSLIAEREGLIEGDQLRFLWVNDFPLFEWSEEEGRPKPCHHPFTSPREEDLERLEEDPLGVRALAYDLVLNGAEIAGGSIRIHTHAIQEKVFRAIGIGQEEAQAKFQFLLEALRYGAPPHGGIAIGIDRLAMELLGVSSIREVIPFPKTQRGVCPLTGAPATVSGEQLAELHLSLEPAAEGSSGR